MIMAQDNKFQGIFIINVLELITVKKCCNVQDLLHGVEFPIISKCYYYIRFQIKQNRECLLGIDSYV